MGISFHLGQELCCTDSFCPFRFGDHQLRDGHLDLEVADIFTKRRFGDQTKLQPTLLYNTQNSVWDLFMSLNSLGACQVQVVLRHLLLLKLWRTV